MDVRTVQKRLLHMLIAGDVGKDAQLDLRIVGVHQRFTLARHKVAAQPAAQLGADGDVLQVRLGRGDAPGAGLGLDKGRVYPAIGGLGVQQSVHIGGEQLRVGAVF